MQIGPDGLTTERVKGSVSEFALQREFPDSLRRIGVTATFADQGVTPDASAVAEIVLRVASGPLAKPGQKSGPGASPNSGIVFSFSSRKWSVGVQDGDNPEEVLQSGTFDNALHGRHSIDIIRRNGRLRIELPDGSARFASNPRIAEWSGRWASWALRQTSQGDVPLVSIKQVRAGW
jgi:hypothetical protein